MEKIGLICVCLSILTLCIFLNSPFSKILPHFAHISAKYTKCFNIFAISLHHSERTHILTKPHHHLKLSSGSEIKAESFLSLQYNINKCRITGWTLHREKKSGHYMVYNQWTSSLRPCWRSWDRVMRVEASGEAL